MAVTSWIRRQFKNGVVTTATATMTNVATTFTVGTGLGTTFPDGSIGPFIVTADQLLATEEKILCQSRSGDTFTVAASGRGYNGTSAQAHTNAVILHTLDAQDLDEANQVANQTLGLIAASGDLLQGSAANTLAKLARGTNGQLLQAGASSLAWSSALIPTTVTATGAVTGTPIVVAGLTGAVAATRYAGGTASGAPGSGTFAQGDFVIDQTGPVWVCTVAGTPGTWVQVGGATDTVWTGFGLLNSWTNFGAPTFNAGYRRVNGRVYLRGAIKGGTVGLAACNLPSGPPTYRPSASIVQQTAISGTLITVDSSGNVTPSGGGGANTEVHLDGVSFDTL